MDCTVDGNKIFQDEFKADGRSILYTTYHNALQDCVSYYRMIRQIEYHNENGFYEPLVLNPNLQTFIFNSDDSVDNDLVPETSHRLYLHE
jgi:hypothetical protein